MSRSLHMPVRILNSLYRGALTGFSNIYHPDDLSNALLSQKCFPEMALSVVTLSRTYLPRTGEEVRNL